MPEDEKQNGVVTKKQPLVVRSSVTERSRYSDYRQELRRDFFTRVLTVLLQRQKHVVFRLRLITTNPLRSNRNCAPTTIT